MTAQRPLTDNGVELWLVDLGRSALSLASAERETPRLAPSERVRAAALADDSHRDRTLAAHIALRIVLERAAGPTIRGQDFVRDTGKPSLRAGVPSFSLSHTDDFALIALAGREPVGADVERIRAVQVSSRRRIQFMAAGAALAEEKPAHRPTDEAFIRAWVRIEALAKATGAGLAHTLRALGLWHSAAPAIPIDIAARARACALECNLTVADIALPPGIAGAVAAPRGAAILAPRIFPADRSGIAALFGEQRG